MFQFLDAINFIDKLNEVEKIYFNIKNYSEEIEKNKNALSKYNSLPSNLLLAEKKLAEMKEIQKNLNYELSQQLNSFC